MMLNPGTGPIERRATLDNAHKNMAALLKAAGYPAAKWRRDVDAEEEGGRFAFLVTCPPDADHEREWECPVYMPGVSLKALKSELYSAPRLYVDDSSWWWDFAVQAIADRLAPSEDE